MQSLGAGGRRFKSSFPDKAFQPLVIPLVSRERLSFLNTPTQPTTSGGGDRGGQLQKALVGERGFEPLLASNQVAYLPIRCKIIRTCCNTIQTLLQVNSNNSKSCDVFIYLAVATFRDIWRHMVVSSGVSCHQNCAKLDLLMRN